MIGDTLSSSDRGQLLEVYARSVMLLELGRCTDWAELFFPHALVRWSGPREQRPIEFKGHDELLDLGRRLMCGEFDIATGRGMPPLRYRHFLSNITLFGHEARRASGYAFLTVTTIGGREPPRWLVSGTYSDRLFRCPAGCWRFESRSFTADSAECTNQALLACANEGAKGIESKRS